jgi:hypothetical protein
VVIDILLYSVMIVLSGQELYFLLILHII